LWIPRWLGEIYSRLFMEFESELFTLSQAVEALGIDKDRLTVALSKLHSKRLLTIFERSRPRIYRVLDPMTFVLFATDRVQNAERIRQERYLPLVVGGLREASKRLRVCSFAVYGSVSRGTAKDNSDVDILVVSPDLHGSMGRRIELLMSVEDSLEGELKWLREHGIHTGLSFHPLRPDEAERFPSLFLDLTEDAVILFDEERFLEMLLTEFKSILFRRGAVRVFIDSSRWYWDLKPDYRFGEAVELA